jgi:hypothetical protein
VEAVTVQLRRLTQLTLVSTVPGDAYLVERWIAQALRPHQSDGLPARHARAASMRLRRLRGDNGTFDDLTETARHLAAAGMVDDLAGFAVAACEACPGDLAVAAFLSEVLPTIPRHHSDFRSLADRARIVSGRRITG